MINRSAFGSQIEVKGAERSRNVADKPESAGWRRFLDYRRVSGAVAKDNVPDVVSSA